MDRLDSLAASTREVFGRIHREAFLGDPAANPRLKVEAIDVEDVAGVPTLVLIAPWTLNGLAFPGERPFPSILRVGGRDLPVFTNELEGIGEYRSVNLAPDVSTIEGPDAARALARSLGRHFRAAVLGVLDEAGVADPSRRRLLRGER